MKIACRTLFDCSLTGVTGHFRASQVPFRDRVGQMVHNETDWNHSRNQQRNWETLLQIIGLRTQPQDITVPEHCNGVWQFEFRSESPGVFEMHNNPNSLAGLCSDCEGVPMLLNLTEQPAMAPTIATTGADQNIWFHTLNTTLEQS